MNCTIVRLFVFLGGIHFTLNMALHLFLTPSPRKLLPRPWIHLWNTIKKIRWIYTFYSKNLYLSHDIQINFVELLNEENT